MTDLQKKMYAAAGHKVELHLVGGYKVFAGRCVRYTQPLDNDPEIASIDIKVQGYDGLYEITEEEIESITIIDRMKVISAEIVAGLFAVTTEAATIEKKFGDIFVDENGRKFRYDSLALCNDPDVNILVLSPCDGKYEIGKYIY